jgi:hypothetical protein
MIYKSISLVLLSLLYIQCYATDKGDKQNSYQVNQTNGHHKISSVWDTEIWNNTSSIILGNFMGDKPSHFPKTEVKLRYDKDNIYVIFSVFDKYIKAIATETHGRVWEDSCVEFFFSPGPDTERGYFNFEANCKGVFLLQYHVDNGKTNGFVSLEDCEKIKIAHSLKKEVEQESNESENWILEYCIPISILSNYMKVDKPDHGVSWRANFYKCADKTSHPHWLTWNYVDYPKPKFHLPEFFGRLDFE